MASPKIFATNIFESKGGCSSQVASSDPSVPKKRSPSIAAVGSEEMVRREMTGTQSSPGFPWPCSTIVYGTETTPWPSAESPLRNTSLRCTASLASQNEYDQVP